MVATINNNALRAIETNDWQGEKAVIEKNGWSLNLGGGIFKLTAGDKVFEGDNLPKLVEQARGGETPPAPRSRRVLDATDAPAPKEIEAAVEDVELDNTGKRTRKVREVRAPREAKRNRYARATQVILGNLSIDAVELANQAGFQYAAGQYTIDAFIGVTTVLVAAGIIPADQVAAVTYTKPTKGGKAATPSPAPEAVADAAPEAEATPEADPAAEVQPEVPVEQPEVTPEAEAPAKPMSKNERRRAARAARAAAKADAEVTETQPEAVEAQASNPQE